MENLGSGDNSTGEDGSGAEFPSSKGETFHIYVLSFAYGILVVSLVWVSGKPEISFDCFFFSCMCQIYLGVYGENRMAFF